MALAVGAVRPFAAVDFARQRLGRAPGPCTAPSRGARLRIRAEEKAVDASTVTDTVRCYMTDEGALVCERLAPGNYKLEAATPKMREESGIMKEAPRCDPARPKECLTYCYVLDDGSMVCEGLPAGEYAIKAAGPEDLENMVKHAVALQTGEPSPLLQKETQKTPSGGPLSGLIGKVTGMFAQS